MIVFESWCSSGFLKADLNRHPTLVHILSLPSSSCTSPHLYSSIPSSLSRILSSLFNVFITPLFYSPLNPFTNPFTPSTLYLSLFFCTPHFSHPTPFPISLSYTILSIPLPHSLSLSSNIYSLIYLYFFPPPLSLIFTTYTYNTSLYLSPFITSFL